MLYVLNQLQHHTNVTKHVFKYFAFVLLNVFSNLQNNINTKYAIFQYTLLAQNWYFITSAANAQVHSCTCPGQFKDRQCEAPL